MNLAELGVFLHNCQQCRLASGRTQVVFGTGNPQAKIMFIGEAPGYYEDKQGIPFVGAAGKLLTELLESAGLSRSEIYIANVIKCRPPSNRDPLSDEIETCKPYLLQQIQLIKPKVVCSLGNFATHTLLGKKVGITKVRGKVFQLSDFVLFPLLHPAAALHQGNLQGPLREDFQKLKKVLDEMIKSEPEKHGSSTTTSHTPHPSSSVPSPLPDQMNLFENYLSYTTKKNY